MTNSAGRPEELDDEARGGRTYPFSMNGFWVLAADIPDKAKLIYWALRQHCNSARGDNMAKPLRDSLADLVGLSAGKKAEDTVSKHIKALLSIGAVDVEVVRYGVNNMKSRNIYTVHLAPPDDYEGLTSLEDFYKRRRAQGD